MVTEPVTLTEEEREILAEHPLPKTRAECRDMPRPCPHVSCRYHLYLDVDRHGNLIMNFPGREPDELMESCALDSIDRASGEQTLHEVGVLTGRTREGVRVAEAKALRPLAARLRASETDIREALSELSQRQPGPMAAAQERAWNGISGDLLGALRRAMRKHGILADPDVPLSRLTRSAKGTG